MRRSIKTLRSPMVEQVSEDDIHAAALQYVRKIAGLRVPSAVNTEAFDAAVANIGAATQQLLDSLIFRPTSPSAQGGPSGAS